ncbi:MAG: hypothetical protein F4X14_01560 [Caldilineaceae bacterium SB0661_bin_32]|uniref:Uncharacterized protein n=1 Tax=Caldilineaceae bacterium SB0661_bin_32 TaxID=2605255 RepID=A0A6B1D2E1_9CHLR|nr:hypothetical protein [Caldilineaceae bacterium SB0661_bin_32]
MTLEIALVHGGTRVALAPGGLDAEDAGYNQIVAAVQARTLPAASLIETPPVHQRVREPAGSAIDLWQRYASRAALRDATHAIERLLEAANRGAAVYLEYSDGSGGVDDAWRSRLLAAHLQWPADQQLRLRNNELAVTIELTREPYWMGARRELLSSRPVGHGGTFAVENAAGVTETPLEVRIGWPGTANLRVYIAAGPVAVPGGSFVSTSIQSASLAAGTETVWRRVAVPSSGSGWRRLILAHSASGSALTALRGNNIWLSAGVGSNSMEFRRSDWRRLGYLEGRESSFTDLGVHYVDGDRVWLRAFCGRAVSTGAGTLYFAPAERWRSYVAMGTPAGTLVDDGGEVVSDAGGVAAAGDVLTAVPGERVEYLALVETASGVRTATVDIGAFYRPRRLTI